MTTYDIVRRMQAKNRDRYLKRLSLPNERRASFAAGILCLAGAIAGCLLVWMLS